MLQMSKDQDKVIHANFISLPYLRPCKKLPIMKSSHSQEYNLYRRIYRNLLLLET